MKKRSYRRSPAWTFTLVVLALLHGLSPRGDPAEVRVRRVDLRTDPWYSLAALDGAGAALARRIVAYRGTIDPDLDFATVRRVPGVGPKKLHRWWPWIAPSSPRDLRHGSTVEHAPARETRADGSR